MTSKKAPAKINLCLRVVGKRSDGYHDIISLMQLISLYDELTFVQRASGIMVKCPGSILPEDENNLVFRAAAGFYDRTGLKPGIEITLQKHIPVGAGLGGGSSDAATTLVTMNELHDSPLSTEELLRLGESLGADVPFFIFGKTAWASGKGEMLTEAPGLPLFWIVLINPGFPVSTREIYQGLNLGLTKKIIKYSIPRFSSVKEAASGLVNDLERVTLALHPALAEIKAFLLKNGALGAAMTGSGPTMFGVFADEASAQRVIRSSAAQNGWLMFCVRSLQGSLG
ncbi:MAG: 4-(cytidine 5'-diphospho)-2-C-methyl-D-erythritol kinase [Syntrophobacterales bacterium]|nr:4-(cytidine 5'-diphospho)-2-C-methyl-D-erythritol kinase [Syntrophobacterales bacterium]